MTKKLTDAEIKEQKLNEPIWDNLLYIVINWNTPSKKNCKRITCRWRIPIVRNSEIYDNRHKIAMWQLNPQNKLWLDRCNIEIHIYSIDRANADLTNRAESIMDLLVDYWVIADDNYFVVNKVLLEYKGVDKENPRAEVYIYY